MLIIRDAKEPDLESLTEIYNWAVVNTTATFDIQPQTLEQRREWFSHYGGIYPLVVAELDGKVAGYGSLSKFRQKEGYDQTVENSIYIHLDYQGIGIGTGLLKELIKRGRDLGHHVIVAGITSGNDVSIKMHENYNFKLCAHFKEVGYKFGKWQDCLFYQLIL